MNDDPLGFIGLFSKTKTEEIDFDFDNENGNNFNGENLYIGNKRSSEEKLDELIKDLKKENEDNK